MRSPFLRASVLSGMAAGFVLAPAGGLAQPLNLAQAPLFLVSGTKPNVLVLYDNSQSMDGTMAGMLIAGSDPSTRGNIARSVITSTMTTLRSSMNWGLASFGINGAPALFRTYAYFFGDSTQVQFTSDCTGGVSNSNGGLRCLPNPHAAINGYSHVTYAHSGDDPAVNDVLYTGNHGPQLYGVGVPGSTNYQVFSTRAPGSGTGWAATDFSGGKGTWSFTPTDAGYLPRTPPHSRMIWLQRAWGYGNNITGWGVINRPVAPDSPTHHAALMSLLAPETNTAGSGEIKNAALYTPLAGALATAKSYFGNTLAGTSTPITQSCQKNFVLLATDGNPTGKTDGSMYSLAQQLNVQDPATGAWTFSTAANDVFASVSALRSTAVGGFASPFDVQTFVIGLGESLANPSSIAVLDRMALLGGGNSQAYKANNAAALAAAFAKVGQSIVTKTAAASSVSLNSGSWNTGSRVFQARFDSGTWSGQVLAHGIASNGSLQTPALWDAGQVINGQHWDTGRQILTYKASAPLGQRGVAFRWPVAFSTPTVTEIDLAMSTALNTDAAGNVDAQGAQRLAYLRGDTSREAAKCKACGSPVFRDRPMSVLGDIVNSAPVHVRGATAAYRDTMEPAAYSGYAAARAALAPVLYVGANDGMLHAFDANTGSELFAYVPWAVRERLSALADTAYGHRYTVDGTPVVADAFYGGQWRTVLVSGMNAGAKGLFALDVSDPANFAEAHAAKVVRWELGDADADVGHIFSQAVIAKTKNGRWTAIVGNGYNSANGRAVLLLVDVETGAVTRIDTLAGSSGSPNGLSGVAAVSSANNGVVDTVYAGDLQGSLWKFDLSATTASSWKVANGAAGTPLPLFRTAAGQAITARPDLTIDPTGALIVAFGTGRYVDVADNATTGTQAVYAIRDTGTPAAMTDLVAQSVHGTATNAAGELYRITTHAVGAPGDGLLPGDNAVPLASYQTAKRGWRLDLPTSGERVVAQVAFRAGKLVLSTLIPNTGACSHGGDGWLMEVDAFTGNRGSSSLDTNGDNGVDSADQLDVAGVSTGSKVVSGVRVGSIPAAPGIARAQNRRLDDKFINTSAGSVMRVREAGRAGPSGRVAWEQIK